MWNIWNTPSNKSYNALKQTNSLTHTITHTHTHKNTHTHVRIKHLNIKSIGFLGTYNLKFINNESWFNQKIFFLNCTLSVVSKIIKYIQ